MARQKPKAKPDFVLFDVLYEDGTLTPNRKVPSSVLGGLEGDAPARAVIEAQDREIAQRSGRVRASIKSVGRSAQRSAPGTGPRSQVLDVANARGGVTRLDFCFAASREFRRRAPPSRSGRLDLAHSTRSLPCVHCPVAGFERILTGGGESDANDPQMPLEI
jgi:hypothetical protein